MNNENLKYPIGRYVRPTTFDLKQAEEHINEISLFPEKMLMLVDDLNTEKLNKIYRTDSWSVRQLIHHCADSHMNAFIRFKLSLTEENPTIKPYKEALWAEMEDYKAPVSPSIQILKGVHRRWCKLMKSMTESDWQKTYVHPESNSSYKLFQVAALYAWHGNHHIKHIELALDNKS
jgi:hypothetical protein